jgi:hypothetical protein
VDAKKCRPALNESNAGKKSSDGYNIRSRSRSSRARGESARKAAVKTRKRQLPLSWAKKPAAASTDRRDAKDKKGRQIVSLDDDSCSDEKAKEAAVGSIPRAPATPAASSSRDAGPLWQYLTCCSLPQDVLYRIQREGYAVLPSVLSSEEADASLSLMWDFVERVSPAVRRTDSNTWYGKANQDPWPHAQRDMFQLHQAGWVFGELREKLAQRVFEPLYGTKQLHCSKDGFCFQRPTRKNLGRRANDHFDQSGNSKGLHCIQASVALLDQEIDDGCFMCFPGSHRQHVEFTAGAGNRDWYMLSDDNKAALEKAGCKLLRVPVKRGDVVLWRSDLAHAGGSPIGRRPGFRAVVYICMMPAALTPKAVYAKKREAYDRLETGSHWPTKETWFRPGRFSNRGFSPQPFFTSPPALSERLKELYGLREYRQ